MATTTPVSQPPADRRAVISVLLLWLSLAGLTSVVLAKGWIAEDAYITFRTADNFLHGHGLRWNVAERVQTYTHPLWLFVVTAGYALVGEPYFATLALSLVATLATSLVLAFRCGLGKRASAFLLSLLLLSASFTTYSTSGLENPLIHLLLALSVCILTRDFANERRRLGIGVLLAALLACTRLDHLLLVTPALLLVAVNIRRGVLLSLLVGLLPLAAWEAFAFFYYGSLWPTTAYAKLLATGVPRSELARLGLRYLYLASLEDPLTFVVIGAGLVAAALSEQRILRALGVGILLEMAYVVSVGGDYMRFGRFLSSAFLLSAFLCAHGARRCTRVFKRCFVVALVGYACLCAWDTWQANAILVVPRITSSLFANNGAEIGSWRAAIPQWVTGRINSQWIAYQANGTEPRISHFMQEDAWLSRCLLLTAPYGLTGPEQINYGIGAQTRRYSDIVEQSVSVPLPSEACPFRNVWKYEGLHARHTGVNVLHTDDIGIFGYHAGPTVHIVDDYGISDAFIARLPAMTGNFAIGHFNRLAPLGYIESLTAGRNLIAEPALAEYFDKLTTVIRGPLWNWSRLRTVFALAMGRYDRLLAAYEPTPTIALSKLPTHPTPFGSNGVLVDLERQVNAFEFQFPTTAPPIARDTSSTDTLIELVLTPRSTTSEGFTLTYYSVGFRNEYTQDFNADGAHPIIISVPEVVARLKDKPVVFSSLLRTGSVAPRSLLFTHILIRPRQTGRYRLDSVRLLSTQPTTTHVSLR